MFRQSRHMESNIFELTRHDGRYSKVERINLLGVKKKKAPEEQCARDLHVLGAHGVSHCSCNTMVMPSRHDLSSKAHTRSAFFERGANSGVQRRSHTGKVEGF
jgi:hypothetical protein